jgi:hypothetical protein
MNVVGGDHRVAFLPKWVFCVVMRRTFLFREKHMFKASSAVLFVFAFLWGHVLLAETVATTPEAGELGQTSLKRLIALEEQLSVIESIDRLKVIRGQGDSLKIKLYYKNGLHAMYKPDHHKWRYKKKVHSRYATKPRRPELAVYRFAKMLLPAIGVVYPPVVELVLTREKLLALSFDDPDTKTDEVKYLRQALGEGRPYMPIAAYRDEAQGVLVGCAALWVKGRNIAPGLMKVFSREQLMESATLLKKRHNKHFPKTLMHQFANVLMMDMLVANNDRTANVLFDMDEDQVHPIDNDDAFVAGLRKTFAKNVFRAVKVYDPVFVEALKVFFAENTDEELAKTVYASYGQKYALKYAHEVRMRHEKVLLPTVEKREPILVSN